MNRRQFIIALAVALWAGPRAVAELIERERQRQHRELIIAQLKYQARQAIEAMQQTMLEQMWGQPYGRSFLDVITSSSVHELHTSHAYGWSVKLG